MKTHNVVIAALSVALIAVTGLGIHEHIAAVDQARFADRVVVDLKKNEKGWADAVDQYNNLTNALNKNCKAVLADVDQSDAADKLGCAFGGYADERDKQGKTEQQIRVEAAQMFTKDTDQSSREFIYSMVHALYTDMSRLSSPEVAGSVRAYTTVWARETNHSN